MPDTKISGLPAATTPLAGTEVLPIVQSSTTVKVATNDLTVRNVRANATTGILQVTGPTAGTTRVMTTPDANFTVARTDAGQAFTGDQTVSGNLGIGTLSMSYTLDVRSGATANTCGLTSTATTAYSATAANGAGARLYIIGGGASGAANGIEFSQGGASELFFGQVQEAGGAGAFVWQGYNGAAYAERMRIDSSGFLGVGTASPQARMHINGDQIQGGGVYFNMTAPASKGAAATLTGAEVIQGYIQYTGAAANLTLPTATNLQAAMPSGVATLNNIAFDFTIINTGTGTATLVVNTGITSVGALTTATNTATTFHIRKTATNTFIVYRT